MLNRVQLHLEDFSVNRLTLHLAEQVKQDLVSLCLKALFLSIKVESMAKSFSMMFPTRTSLKQRSSQSKFNLKSEKNLFFTHYNPSI